MRLPSEIFYYSGQCADSDTQQQIKEQFLEILTRQVIPLFDSICSRELNCTVDAVAVTCGEISEKRKRRSYRLHHVEKRAESHITIFTFDIVSGWEKGNMTDDEAYRYTDNLQAWQKDIIANKLADGTLELTGFTVKVDSFQTARYGSLSCDKLGWKIYGTSCSKYQIVNLLNTPRANAVNICKTSNMQPF